MLGSGIKNATRKQNYKGRRQNSNLGVADLEYDLPPKFSRGNS